MWPLHYCILIGGIPKIYRDKDRCRYIDTSPQMFSGVMSSWYQMKKIYFLFFWNKSQYLGLPNTSLKKKKKIKAWGEMFIIIFSGWHDDI